MSAAGAERGAEVRRAAYGGTLAGTSEDVLGLRGRSSTWTGDGPVRASPGAAPPRRCDAGRQCRPPLSHAVSTVHPHGRLRACPPDAARTAGECLRGRRSWCAAAQPHRAGARTRHPATAAPAGWPIEQTVLPKDDQRAPGLPGDASHRRQEPPPALGLRSEVTNAMTQRNQAAGFSEGILWRHVFPDPEDRPAKVLQVSRGHRVALSISFELGDPPSVVGRGHLTVIGTSMPEAAVDEHGDLRTREGDVDRSSRKAGNGVLDAVAVPRGVQQASQRKFRPGVPPGMPAHACRHTRRARHRAPGHVKTSRTTPRARSARTHGERWPWRATAGRRSRSAWRSRSWCRRTRSCRGSSGCA